MPTPGPGPALGDPVALQQRVGRAILDGYAEQAAALRALTETVRGTGPDDPLAESPGPSLPGLSSHLQPEGFAEG